MSTETTILTNLVTTPEFTRKVLPHLRLSYFQEPADKAIFRTFVEYYQKYNCAPTKDALKLELSESTSLSEDAFEDAVTRVDELAQDESPNLQWLVDKTESWCQERALYNAIMESISIIDGENENKTKHALPDILKTALAVSFDTALGHDYLEDAESRFEYYNEEHARIPFDLHMLNKVTNGGIPRKTLNIISGGTNVGKAQPVSTPIPTPTGWATMGELKVGDFVFGQNGKPTRVTGVFPQGVKDVYEVSFADGRTTRSCKEHLWDVHVTNREAVTMELSEVIRKKELSKYKNRLYVPLCEAVEYESVEKVIPPYLMGVYLSDGSTSSGSILITKQDEYLLSRVASGLHNSLSMVRADNNTVRLTGDRGQGGNVYINELRRHGIFGVKSPEKFIPREYIMQSTAHERFELLSGLIDGDGYIGKNKTIQYYTTSPKLRDDVIELVRSLGGIANYADKQTSYNGKFGLPSYTVTIRFPPEAIEKLSISRGKANSHLLVEKTKPLKLRIDDIQHVGEEECVCIAVEADDSLYVTENYIVTHNTMIMCHLASAYLMQGLNVLYITLEMAEQEIANRIDANLFDMTVNQVTKLDRARFSKNINQIRTKATGRLKIKEYPTGAAHVGHIRNLLDDYKLKHGFIPDVILVDYIGIMASSRVKLGAVGSYFYVKAIAEELRGLAVEYDVPLWTAVQVNRGGYSNSDVDVTDTAESFGLPATADFMMAVIRTDELDALGQLLIKQLKSRYGNKNWFEKFVVGVDPDRMKLFDLEDSAQRDIIKKDAPQEEHEEKKEKFKGLKV